MLNMYFSVTSTFADKISFRLDGLQLAKYLIQNCIITTMYTLEQSQCIHFYSEFYIILDLCIL